MRNHRFGQPRLRAAPTTRLGPMLTLAISVTLLIATPSPMRAQGTTSWGAPYCEAQPRISAIFDHKKPLYGGDSHAEIMLFSGDDIRHCDSPTGVRPGYHGHSGWDFTRRAQDQGCGAGHRAGQRMSLVYAAESGTVRRSRWDRPAHDGPTAEYGLHIDLGHDEDLASLYGHLAVLMVDEGESVGRGQLIGALGTTGNSTGPHLHFQAAKGSDASVSANSFDPYGWNKKFGPGYLYPGFEDPHRGNGWSIRTITPGQGGPACPSDCGTWEIDDDHPDVVYGCAGGGQCPHWKEEPQGIGGSHHWTYPNGASKDYWVRYYCRPCQPGTFLVEAHVPEGVGIANSHVARYEIENEVAIMDQHMEGGIWHPLGIYHFQGTPMIELNDRSDRYDYTASAPQKLGADAVRFRRICGGIPTNVPDIPPGWGSGQQGEG